jgi:hypothetical protein
MKRTPISLNVNIYIVITMRNIIPQRHVFAKFILFRHDYRNYEHTIHSSFPATGFLSAM